jgi:hypothetical protein
MRVPYYFFKDTFPAGMDLASPNRIFDMTPDYPQPLAAGMVIHKRITADEAYKSYRILEVHAGVTVTRSQDNCFFILVEEV